MAVSRWRTAGILAAGILAALFITPSAASASPSTHTIHLQRGMNVVRIDPTVAAAHGFKVVTYSDGSQQAVPADPRNTKLKPSPRVGGNRMRPQTVEDTLYGTCGYSFIEGAQDASHKIWLRSGFHVKEDAIQYAWLISLYDQNGHSYQGASGSLLMRTDWNRTWNGLNQYGHSLDEVESDNSYAMLWWGGICVSEGPWILMSITY